MILFDIVFPFHADPYQSIANFSYESKHMADLFFSIMEDIQFEGVSVSGVRNQLKTC